MNTNEFNLEPADNFRLAKVCGQLDEHIHQIERRLGIQINYRGHSFCAIGEVDATEAAQQVLQELFAESAAHEIDARRVHLSLQAHALPDSEESSNHEDLPRAALKLRHGVIRARSANQSRYLKSIEQEDLNFGVGPAGTGKTFLAVACAALALEQDLVQRLVLVRPAVEAGERLGFLPGDMAQKIDPYLRPVYDALHEMLGFERVERLMERGAIEVAPLAFMRGRTLNEAFVILDEAQNTTIEQMKMFLTRIGFNSKAVVTGDVTQTDLPKHQRSGLRHAIEILRGVEGVQFNFFTSRDVVRHPLVKRIIKAYQSDETNPAGDDGW